MDQNQIPSSPLQHHRSSSSHHNAQTNDAQGPETSKLPPASGVPRPSQTTLASPSSPSTSLAWPSTEESPTIGYVDQDMKPGQPVAWRNQGGESWDDGSRTHPVASSSRCPSPTSVPMTLCPTSVSASSHSQVTQLAHLTSKTGSLCTSEPLNRPPNQPFDIPNLDIAASQHRGSMPKRGRASSLPESAPITKKIKSHYAFQPLTTKRRLQVAGPKERQYASQEARAEELRRALKRGDIKPSSKLPLTPVETSIKPHQPYRAAHIPPVNLVSLRPLDAAEIMKNPQLRHDLLFDSLAFRPVNTACPSSSPPSTYIEIITSSRQITSSESESDHEGQKCHANVLADVYWDTLGIEIETGCRCVRYDVRYGINRREKALGCKCGGWMRDKTESEWWTSAKEGKWTSRIPDVILTLRQILITLMGSTTPCPNHFAHSLDPKARAHHEATCPTITHALVPELYNALDPEFLTLQARRGVFGLGIFEMIGEAMKVHCAPVRDVMVDDMVAVALRGEVTLGLRKCFDCVEVMKLDIANHQVHALRPYLWNSAIQHEQSVFESILSTSKLNLETSVTRSFIRQASQRVLAGIPPKDRMHMVGQCGCQSTLVAHRTGLVIRALAEGWTELVFGDWSLTDCSWPPIVQRRVGDGAGIILPESLRMDARRFRNFSREMIDITITQMILLAYRDLLQTSVTTRLSRSQIQEQLTLALTDIDYIMESQANQGSPFLAFEGANASVANSKVKKVAQEFGSCSDLALRLALRLVRIDQVESPCKDRSLQDVERIKEVSRTLEVYIRTHIRPDSRLFLDQMERFKNVVKVLFTNHLLGMRYDPSSIIYDSNALVGDLTSCARSTNEMLIESPFVSTLSLGLNSNPHGNTGISKESVLDLNIQASSTRRARLPSSPQLSVWLDTVLHDQEAVIQKNGMEIVSLDMRAVVEKMGRIAGFHLAAFMGVYGEKGMMIGS